MSSGVVLQQPPIIFAPAKYQTFASSRKCAQLAGNIRFVAQLVTGHTPHEKILKAIEIYGTKIAPIVRKKTATPS